MAAGSGATAVAHLNGIGPEAVSGMKPEPPSSAPSGRPQPIRNTESTESPAVGAAATESLRQSSKDSEAGGGSDAVEVWMEIFQSIAGHDKSIKQEAFTECAVVAKKFQVATSEFVSVCLGAGLNEDDVRKALKQVMVRCEAQQRAEKTMASANSVSTSWVYHADERDGGDDDENGEDVVRSVHRNKRLSGKFIKSTKRSSFSMPCCQTTSNRRSKVNKSSNCAVKHVPGHPSQQYDIGVLLGEGSFGIVRKAKHRQTSQIHAMKEVAKNKLVNGEQWLHELWAEVSIMKTLDHPHIMRLYYTFEDEAAVYMASDLCSGGELFDTLDDTGFFSEQIAALLMRQILGAVNYLHCSKFICHRDLKPENFLVLKRTALEMIHLKMIDFGTAKHYKDGVMVTKVCTAHYVAPEVLKRGEVPYTEKVDVWSCGVMLYMLLCGFMPFHAEEDKELLGKVKKGKFTFNPARVWDHISADAKDLITNMICKDVTKRSTATEAYRHKWTQNEDANHLSLMPDDEIVKSMRTFLKHNRLKRVALQIIARQISDDEITKLRNIFLSIDADQSGTLTIEEMDEALMKLDVNEQSRQEMAAIMRSIHVEGSGELEYTEFLAAMLKREQYLQDDVCRGAFHLLDQDGDGMLSTKDLETLMESGNGKISKATMEEIDQIMSDVDEDQDGGVNFEEFFTLMSDESEQLGNTAVSIRWQRGKKEAHVNFSTVDIEFEDEEDAGSSAGPAEDQTPADE